MKEPMTTATTDATALAELAGRVAALAAYRAHVAAHRDRTADWDTATYRAELAAEAAFVAAYNEARQGR